VADRAGHAMHTALVSKILRDQSFWDESFLDDEEDHELGANAHTPISDHV